MHIGGLMEMYGKAIHLAIEDFRYIHKYHKELEAKRKSMSKKGATLDSPKYGRISEILQNYETAKFFLFSPNGLEAFIDQSGLPINLSYVRRTAKAPEDEYQKTRRNYLNDPA